MHAVLYVLGGSRAATTATTTDVDALVALCMWA